MQQSVANCLIAIVDVVSLAWQGMRIYRDQMES